MFATMFRSDWCEKRHWTKRMLFIKRRMKKKHRWKSCYHVWTRWHMIFICILPTFGWEECLRSGGDSLKEWKWQEIKIILSFLVKNGRNNGHWIIPIHSQSGLVSCENLPEFNIYGFCLLRIEFLRRKKKKYIEKWTPFGLFGFCVVFSHFLRFVYGSRDSMLLRIFVNFVNSDYFEFD